MSETDGGPAFATGNPEQGGNEGMSLRDWFAGMALQGLLASEDVEVTLAKKLPHRTINDVTDDAYRLADAMIAARDEA